MFHAGELNDICSTPNVLSILYSYLKSVFAPSRSFKWLSWTDLQNNLLSSTVRNLLRVVIRNFMLIYMLKGYGNEHAKFRTKVNYICLFTSVLCRSESVNLLLWENFKKIKQQSRISWQCYNSTHFGSSNVFILQDSN